MQLLNLALTMIPLAPGDGSPLAGPATKVVAILFSLAAIAVAWSGLKVLGGSSKGNVKRDLNVGGSVTVGIVLLIVAVSLGGFVAFLTGIFNFTGITG